MPKSKRDKKISLTRTTKKGLPWKQRIVEDVRNCLEKYSNVFVFTVFNMRNTLLKELRSEWKKDSRFIFGKNRIMQLAFGRAKGDETYPGLSKLSSRLINQCGLLFTNKPKEYVLEWSKNYNALEYARSGFVATETITLPEGPLEDFAHSMEPFLRQLGMPTKLDKGIIHLIKDYTVCKEGQTLNAEQAKILKLIAKPMSVFTLEMNCGWSKEDGFESYVDTKTQSDDADDNDENANDDDDDDEDGDQSMDEEADD